MPLESSWKVRLMGVERDAQLVELRDMLSPVQLSVDSSSSEGR